MAKEIISTETGKVERNRGYWGFEEITPEQAKKSVGGGCGGCGGCGCGCGCGCGSSSSSSDTSAADAAASIGIGAIACDPCSAPPAQPGPLSDVPALTTEVAVELTTTLFDYALPSPVNDVVNTFGTHITSNPSSGHPSVNLSDLAVP